MILYIDTSSSYLYTGIVENGVIKKEIKKEYGHKLSEVALPEIVSMFEETKIAPQDIKKIIVVDGPGSFTGIRIGITIAKVYAWSLNIPITAITSLEAMALSSAGNEVKVPLIDARRGYCYAAIFKEDGSEILKPSYLTYTNLQEKLVSISKYRVITNEEDKIQITALTVEQYEPNIAKIVEKYQDKEPINPHAVNPEYLKLTEAEESKIS